MEFIAHINNDAMLWLRKKVCDCVQFTKKELTGVKHGYRPLHWQWNEHLDIVYDQFWISMLITIPNFHMCCEN